MANKTILLVGACGSIGQVLAHHWAKQGHDLLLLDYDPLALQSLDKRLTGDPTLIPFDLWASGYSLYEKLAHEIAQDYTHLDAVVMVSGTATQLQPLQHLPPETILKMFQVNVTAPLWLVQTLLPLLQKSASGQVIFTTHPHLRQTQKHYWHAFGMAQSALNTMIDELKGEENTLKIKIKRAEIGWLDNAFSRSIFPAGESHWLAPESVISIFDEVLQ